MTPHSSPGPPGGNPTDPGSERRRWPRYPAGKLQVRLMPEPEPPLLFSAVEDISVGDIRLALDRRLGVGTTLNLSLQRPGGDLVCLVSGTVVRVDEKLTGLFIIGCAFGRLLTDEELQGLL